MDTVGNTVGIKLGNDEGCSVWVGCGVGDTFTTFLTVIVADMYGLHTFTSHEASSVTVRDDVDKVEFEEDDVE